MKKTKVVCTMGPNTNDRELMRKHIQNGMDVARFNFSHCDHEEQKGRMDMLKELREEEHATTAILLDTKGPEIRTGVLKDGKKIKLETGKTFTLTTEDIVGDENKVSITYKGLAEDVSEGKIILIDDGLIGLKVIGKTDKEIHCEIINGGELGEKKGVNVPGVPVRLPAITEKDKEDIKYACDHDGDYLAISFVNTADNIREVRNLCAEFGKPNMPIISKIETQYAMDNLDEIIDETDIVMIARGDLGIETGVENLPLYQQMMIDKCRAKGKRVIMATQMMSSMKNNIRPTNAEVTDVANAVLAGCDAVMTSDETTMGKYPVETIQNMAEICKKVESYYKYDNKYGYEAKDVNSIIAQSVVTASNKLDSKVIVAATMSGHTAASISNLRPNAMILATVPNEKVAKALALNYGVYSTVVGEYDSTDELVSDGKAQAQKFMDLETGDKIVITGGFPNTGVKVTNFMKIEKM